MKQVLVSFLILLVISFRLYGQEPSMIAVAAKVTDSSVVLRYAPSTYEAWDLLNEYGYKIVRYTIMREGKLLKDIHKEVLNKDPIKPLPPDNWVDSTDKYVPVAYQAIYGESFDIDLNNLTVFDAYKISRQEQNRYVFGLMACNFSRRAALLSGLLYEDKNIKKNETYLYRVYSLVPDSLLHIDSGFVYVDASKVSTYPKPPKPVIDVNNEQVSIFWDPFVYSNVYIAWNIERSVDGRNYEVINTEPIIYLNTGGNRLIKYIDSLPDKNRTYFYRIRGITVFSEQGPPSDTAGAKFLATVDYAPLIKTVEGKDNVVFIEWEYPEEYNKSLRGFKIISATKRQGPYKSKTPKLLLPEEREYIDSFPDYVNYYRVVAVDNKGEEHMSIPILFQPVDTFPPMRPTGLGGKIDSSGNVMVWWKRNNEEDLRGYRVFYANSPEEEFTQVTSNLLTDTFFVFTTTLNTLSSYVYVKVKAEDLRYNSSEFSEILKLKRPDTIKPAAPVFKKFKVLDNCVYLEWAPSRSSDVVKHILFRKKNTDSTWLVLAIFDSTYNFTHYCDTSIESNVKYQYVIAAQDDSKNLSFCNTPVTIKTFRAKPNKLNVLTAERDINNNTIILKWKMPDKDVKTIIIYRRQQGEPYSKYKFLTGDKNMFIDKELQLNTEYEYRLKFVFSDLSEMFSNSVKIKF